MRCSLLKRTDPSRAPVHFANVSFTGALGMLWGYLLQALKAGHHKNLGKDDRIVFVNLPVKVNRP